MAAGYVNYPGTPGHSAPLLARLTAGDIGGTEVRVDSASPALPLSGDASVAAGDTYTLTLGDGQTNLGSGSDITYTINWNDGCRGRL